MDRLGCRGRFKHLNRVWNLCDRIRRDGPRRRRGDEDLLSAMHKTINDVTIGVEPLALTRPSPSFTPSRHAAQIQSRAAAKREAIMTLGTADVAHDAASGRRHLGASGRRRAGDRRPLARCRRAMLVDDTVTLPIQINGKRRGGNQRARRHGQRQRLKSWRWRRGCAKGAGRRPAEKGHRCAGTDCECRCLKLHGLNCSLCCHCSRPAGSRRSTALMAQAQSCKTACWWTNH